MLSVVPNGVYQRLIFTEPEDPGVHHGALPIKQAVDILDVSTSSSNRFSCNCSLYLRDLDEICGDLTRQWVETGG